MPVGTELFWARKLAQGPLDQLIASKYTFISSVEVVGTQDPILWYGLTRLGLAVVDGNYNEDPRLLRVILALGRTGKLPALDPLFEHLQRFADGK